MGNTAKMIDRSNTKATANARVGYETTEPRGGFNIAVPDQPQVREMTDLLTNAVRHQEKLLEELGAKLSDLVITSPDDGCCKLAAPARNLAPFAGTLHELADAVGRSNDRLRFLIDQVQF